MTKCFYVAIEFDQDQKFSCSIEYFYVVTELAKVKRIYVMS